MVMIRLESLSCRENGSQREMSFLEEAGKQALAYEPPILGIGLPKNF